ncbi:MAG: ferritin-like domain-containing protein [Woeseiaceae bacterium]|nr:ferritin-like domain-containing protein [Woeseiaceae bacterium]
MPVNANLWKHFNRLFEQRSNRPLPPLDADLDYTQLPRSLARSLAVFQLGESGGGTVVSQARASRLDAVDDDYVCALAHFVAEEHRHASILAICVRLLGGELIRTNWTAKLFVLGRRLMGLRLKILVLLAAEVVGLCYYRLIASRLPPCNLRDWLLDIAADEASHLEFHCAFLRSQLRGPVSRFVFLSMWRSLMTVSEVVVLIDHRKALHDLYIDRSDVRAAWRSYRHAVESAVLRSSADFGRASSADCVGTV